LLLCQFARDVWRDIKKTHNLQLKRREFTSPKHWLFDFLANATEVEATVLAVGFWHIWEARNDVRNNRSQPDPRRVCAKTLAYVDMIIHHCFKQQPGNRRESSTQLRWSPPPPGEVLVNTDAALFDDRRSMAMGMVIRDNSGVCLASASLPLQGYTSPEMAEAMALREAVSITRDKGFSKVIFATDCLSLIQRLNSTVHDRSQVGVVVKDIESVAAGFSSASFRHVKRSLNEAAHILARACNLPSLGFISNCAPVCIRKTLCTDVF
jgi:ribonuclease HI